MSRKLYYYKSFPAVLWGGGGHEERFSWFFRLSIDRCSNTEFVVLEAHYFKPHPLTLLATPSYNASHAPSVKILCKFQLPWKLPENSILWGQNLFFDIFSHASFYNDFWLLLISLLSAAFVESFAKELKVSYSHGRFQSSTYIQKRISSPRLLTKKQTEK